MTLSHITYDIVYIQLVINLEEAQDYEIGSEFLSFIQRQKCVSDELEDYHFEEFDPEAEYVSNYPIIKKIFLFLEIFGIMLKKEVLTHQSQSLCSLHLLITKVPMIGHSLRRGI